MNTGIDQQQGRPSLAAAPALGAEPRTPTPCDLPGSRIRRVDPPGSPGLAVALSGGGFRATLSGLGVLRFLADAGLLAEVRYSSSVSGGSVANGLFAAKYDVLAKVGFTGATFDEHVLGPFLGFITQQSLSARLVRRVWKIIGPRNRTELLAEELDSLFFGGLRLADLTDQCRFIVNAANTSTSARFSFEREAVGDYVIGELPTSTTDLRLGQAVAASAAVPGLLAPLELPGLRFPCPQGDVRLVDGGVYDNMGLEPVDRLDSLLVVLNAGGVFVTGKRGRIPLIRDLQLAQSLLYRQTTALRRRDMVERFQAYEQSPDDPPSWGRRGVLFQLSTTMDSRLAPDWAAAHPSPPDPDGIAFVETSFDRFDTELSRRLLYAGWWLTGANLATYYRDVLPQDLPAWRELP